MESEWKRPSREACSFWALGCVRGWVPDGQAQLRHQQESERLGLRVRTYQTPLAL